MIVIGRDVWGLGALMKINIRLLTFLLVLGIFASNFSVANNSCTSNSGFDLVFIPDIALQEVLEKQLNNVDAYTCSGLQKLEVLNMSAKNIKSLEGLQYALNLKKIVARNNQISDLSPIGSLQNLQEVYFNNNEIISVLPLQNAKSLVQVDITNNKVSDISVLSELEKLSGLFVGNNPLSYEDLLQIRNLHKIQRLGLSNLELTSLNQVFQLLYNYEALVVLDVNNNAITDLSLFPNFVNLKSLSIAGNGIKEIGPIAQMKKLTTIRLNKNDIEDISPLAKLITLEKLYLNGNNIKSIDALMGLPSLLYVDVSFNLIKNTNRFVRDSLFKDRQDGYIKATLNCLTSSDISNLNVLKAQGIQVVVGGQRLPFYCR